MDLQWDCNGFVVVFYGFAVVYEGFAVGFLCLISIGSGFLLFFVLCRVV